MGNKYNDDIRWQSIPLYIDNICPLKFYLAIPKDSLGGVRIISGNESKEWIIKHYSAICPIPRDGMDKFVKDTFNYGERDTVLTSRLGIGDKVFYDNEILTVCGYTEYGEAMTEEGIIIKGDTVERL